MGNQLSLKTSTLFMVNPFIISYSDVNPRYVLKI